MVRRLAGAFDVPSAALALPAVSLGLACLVTVVMGATGVTPPWHRTAANMAEAAALEDAATVAQLLRDGEDPEQRWRVRAGLLADGSLSLTPLEAAIAVRRADIVDALLSARRDTGLAGWVRARCLAASVGDADVEAAVDAHRPPGQPPVGGSECAGVVRPW